MELASLVAGSLAFRKEKSTFSKPRCCEVTNCQIAVFASCAHAATHQSVDAAVFRRLPVRLEQRVLVLHLV